MSEGQGIRRATIDGLPAMVFDGLMSQQESAQMFHWLRARNWQRTESARPDTKAFLHWVCNIDLEQCRLMPLYAATMEAVQTHFPERWPQACYRSYCNHASYGDMLFTHTDSQPDTEGLTALWYFAPQWDVEWGGETLLFNSRKDAEFVVSPRPGRLLVFDGRILHAGRAPSRTCVLPRLTFALKLASTDLANHLTSSVQP
ncbi:MAG: 2OG-Fe(II) oxygenase [Gammaproteobacteria bacterium]|nr:2OG-Fe(II) oxygenase [Gammaproteobacteria bacterium]